MEKWIHKEEEHSSQHTLQRIASVKDSSVYLSHVAADILCSTTPAVLNQGKLFCVCLIHININTAYTFLPLIGGQTASLGPLVFFESREKILYDSKSQTVETCQGFFCMWKFRLFSQGEVFMYLSDTIWSVFLNSLPRYYSRLEETYSRLGLYPKGNLVF